MGSRERECGYSLAFSIAPNAALFRPLYYDRRRLNHRLAKGRYVDTITLIFLSDVIPSEVSGPSVTKPIMEGRYFVTDVRSRIKMPGPDGKPKDVT